MKNILNGLPRALQHDYVITYKGKPIKEPGGLKNSFKTACQKSEIPCGQKVKNGIIFHDIRRTVKTNMLSAGIDKTLIDVTLGHSLQGMDIHYIAPSGEVLRKAMDKYTQWLDGELNFANVDQTVDQAPKKEIGE